MQLGDFAWEAIDDEAARAGSTTEELIVFSVLYYLADADSGRVSRSLYPPSEDFPGVPRIARSQALSVRPVSDPE